MWPGCSSVYPRNVLVCYHRTVDFKQHFNNVLITLWFHLGELGQIVSFLQFVMFAVDYVVKSFVDLMCACVHACGSVLELDLGFSSIKLGFGLGVGKWLALELRQV